MDTFKKIYLALILVTVFVFGALAMISLGKISIYGETGMIIYLLATNLLVGVFILSRIANIFGNRQNLFIAYAGAALTLVYMILMIIDVMLISAKNYDAVLELNKAIEFFSKIETLVLLNTLVFEIPYVNSTHKKIQYVAAGILTILFLLSAFNDSSSSISILGSNSYSSSSYTSSSLYSNNTDQSSEDLKTVLTYTGIALIIINPMLRVFWIDKDFYNARDVYDVERQQTQLTVNDLGKVTNNQNQLNRPEVDPHAQPTVPIPAPVEEKPKPKTFITEEVAPIEENVITEPVVNTNYKPTDVSEILIPSVDGSVPTPPDNGNNNPTT